MLDITRAFGLNFLFPANDGAVGRALKHHGEFAPAELELMAAYLDASDGGGAFVDVGANIGAICLPLASGRPDLRFVAVEGHRGLAQVLSANALSNGLYNVEVINAVVGEAEGLIDFPSTSLGGSGNFGLLGLNMTSAQPMERARMCTVDDIAPADTKFIKVDVEGHEAAVLRGASRTLEKTRPVWLLEAGALHEASNREARSILSAAGYSLFWFYSPFVNLKSPPKTSEVALPRTGDGGVVALPPGTPNLWDLPPVGAEDVTWPAKASTYPYLKRFGY